MLGMTGDEDAGGGDIWIRGYCGGEVREQAGREGEEGRQEARSTPARSPGCHSRMAGRPGPHRDSGFLLWGSPLVNKGQE